uniref:Uncharacterized protein n=1 Tax=Macrostomum lignano TaxID=282301 RepID=A0A1I8HIE6_9PLAT
MIFDIPLLFYQLKLDNWNVSMPEESFDAYFDGKLGLRSIAYRGVNFQLPHETIIYCRYNSEPCSFENFTVYKDEDRFMCMSFNPTNRTIAQSGEGNGLYLVLYNYAFSFLTNAELVDNTPGFRVALHENGFKPDMKTGFSVPYGYKTTAQMRVQLETKVNREAAPCSDELPNATYIANFSMPGHLENQTFFGTYQD